MSDRIWIIDTCSLTAIKALCGNDLGRYVFGNLTRMVKAGQLLFPRQVMRELVDDCGTKDLDLPANWAKQYAKEASGDAPSLMDVKRVLGRVGAVLDTDKPSGTDEADPYLIAQALALAADQKKATVVTEERRDTPVKMSLSTACGLWHVPVVPVAPFLHYNRIWDIKAMKLGKGYDPSVTPEDQDGIGALEEEDDPFLDDGS